MLAVDEYKFAFASSGSFFFFAVITDMYFVVVSFHVSSCQVLTCLFACLLHSSLYVSVYNMEVQIF